MGRFWYRPLAFGVGTVAGMAAAAGFKRLWQRAAGQQDAPDPTDERRTWGEVLAEAALQGAVFSMARAMVRRGGAVGVRRLTGTWPA